MRSVNLNFIIGLTLSGLALVGAGSAFARGGETGGGGNGLHSTPDQVQQAIASIRGPTDYALRIMSYRTSSATNYPVGDARAKKIIADILNVYPSDYFNYIKPLQSAACRDAGEDRDGGVVFHAENGRPVLDEICLSVERLSVYAPEDLQAQISALVIHELSHLAGHNEDDAIYIQNYVLKELGRDCTVFMFFGEGFVPSIWVTVSADGPVVTDFKRYALAPNGKGHNSIDILTGQDSSTFSLAYSDAGGKMKFIQLNTDGTYTNESTEWGPVTYASDRADTFFTTNITSSSIVVDGAKLIPTYLALSRSCLR